MTKNDREAFAVAFFGLQEYFEKNHSKSIIETYFKSLKDLTISEFREVCLKAIQTCRFFPKIAELREFAGVGGNSIEKEKPLLAWLTFQETIKTRGPDFLKTANLSDPVIPIVIRMLGGVARIRMWTENELPFRQKDFIEYYDLAARHDTIGLIPFNSTENHSNKNLFLQNSTNRVENKSQQMTCNPFPSVFRQIEIETFKPPDTPSTQIKKLIRHLIDEGEDVSSFKKTHPEIYDAVINRNREGYGYPGA